MIAVDWGTSSFRAYRLDAAGAVQEERSADAGLLRCNGNFEAVLARQLAGWDDPLVLMAGMVGSRNGWREVPYVGCPAGLDAVAAGLCEVNAPLLPGRRVFIAPGVSHRPADAPPDVMRGEEAQVLGVLDRLRGAGPHTVCLPGTHSKWVQVDGGRIVALRTAMTGELYALLRQHSLLAALMVAQDHHDDDAFANGVAASARDGGLLHHLFSVRTLALFDTMAPSQAPSYLSGLLIGHELRSFVNAGAATVLLVGSSALVQRYRQALRLLGAAAEVHDETASARGLFLLARSRALLR